MPSSDLPTLPDPGARAPGQWRSRVADRRSGLADLVAAFSESLSSGDARAARARFEQVLCRLAGARAVQLQVGRVLATGRAPVLRDGTRIDLPVGSAMPAVLQAVAGPSSRLDPWGVQLLQAGAQLAGVLLEVERLQRSGLQATRAGGVAPSTGLVGSSPEMRALRERIGRVARTDFAVLVEGESGVGKELVARHLHELSRRARAPFVAVNCAALVETLLEAELFGIEERTATGVRGRRGKFELADGGTIFLDEIGDLSPAAQAKLLRALQDMSIERVGGHSSRRVDVRVVAATNRALAELVAAGRFRADLFYRLNCVEIWVPPLRVRRGDIAELVEYFLGRHRDGRDLSVAADVLEALTEHDWPGNVRELERVVQRAVTLADADRIELKDLPATISKRYADALQPALDADDSLRTWAARYVRLVLARCDNNKRRACDVLDISYHTLQAHLRRPPQPGPGGTGDGRAPVADVPAGVPGGAATVRLLTSGPG